MPNGTTPSLGAAIGLQPKATFETESILKSMRLADQQVQEEMERKRAERLQRKKDREKYQDVTRNIIIKGDLLYGGHVEAVQTEAGKFFGWLNEQPDEIDPNEINKRLTDLGLLVKKYEGQGKQLVADVNKLGDPRYKVKSQRD